MIGTTSSRRNRLRACIPSRLAAFLILCLSPPPALTAAIAVSEEPAAEASAQVLLLHSYDRSAAPFRQVNEVFGTELQKLLPDAVSLIQVNLDAWWGIPENHYDLLAKLLRDRSAIQPNDLVVVMGEPAVEFSLRYRDSIQPSAPVVAVGKLGRFRQTEFHPPDVTIWTDFSYTDIIDHVLRLLPHTELIVMVFGDSPHARNLAAEAERELLQHPSGIAYEFTNDLTVQEVRERLSALPPEAAVFYGMFNVDAAGVILDSGLAIVHQASTAPVFGVFAEDMGDGIVGGRLIDGSSIGRGSAIAAAKVLEGDTVAPIQHVALTGPVYDWRELDRWQINPNRLPEGSQILYEATPMWKAYAAGSPLASAC